MLNIYVPIPVTVCFVTFMSMSLSLCHCVTFTTNRTFTALYPVTTTHTLGVKVKLGTTAYIGSSGQACQWEWSPQLVWRSANRSLIPSNKVAVGHPLVSLPHPLLKCGQLPPPF